MLVRKVFHFITKSEPPSPGRPVDDRIIFERTGSELIGKTRNVLFYEKNIVLPSGSNFYLLRLECPEETANYYEEIFDRVLKNFEPLK